MALTLTFGVFVGTIVVNLREVEDQAALVLGGYVPLAMVSSDLAQRHSDLQAYLDQGVFDANQPNEVASAIQNLRLKRELALKEIIKTLNGIGERINSNGQDVSRQLPLTVPMVNDIKQRIADTAPLYDSLTAAPLLHLPKPLQIKADPGWQFAYDALDPAHRAAYDAAYDTLQRLRDAERPTGKTVSDVRDNWQRRMMRTKDWLAVNERTILMRAIYLGIAAMVLCAAITAWVAVTMRPLARLREGARRIAAGDYGKRVSETGPTEIADLAREFNSMGRAVQEREEEMLRAARLAMVGKMAAQIAHEVRNPLSSISLNTELLGDELGDDASEARELCSKILAEVNRLTEVTETYLGLRGGQPRLAKESLNAIIGDLVGFVRNDLATRQVELSTSLDPDDPTGYIDANQIRQCLINLVRNAADAVSANGGGRVVLRTRGDRSRVEIAVEDNGVGIADDVMPRLFDPFFSTKKGGSGLGLALTQQIIRDHGGEIHVASRVGRGTTFTLSVPVG